MTLSVSVTEGGRTLAARLPYEHVHGQAAATVRDRWADTDGFVLFLAVGAAVRIVAPLLAGKDADPAVVCVDEAGRWVVPILGGHAAGANDLAAAVASLLGATPVLTTATDATAVPALDSLPGFIAAGDVAAVTAALLDGRPVALDNPLGWPVPPPLAASFPALFRASGPHGPQARGELCITDRDRPSRPGLALLHPPSLVLGVGTSTDADTDEVASLVDRTLAAAGLARASVAELATIDRRRSHPAITGLALPVRAFTAAELATVPVPNPSVTVAGAVGTPSVAEAAALMAAGEGATLVVTKQASSHATVAVARRAGPRGHLTVVGLGPGHARHRTPAATAAVRHAQVVVGYGPYVDQCADLLSPAQEVVRSPIGDEAVRAKQALAEAAAGRQVAVVCSGDAGVFAMAAVVLEVAAGDPSAHGIVSAMQVMPGVTAAVAAAAVLGAPLGHDHALISLSDLHTPWDVIEARVRAAAQADLAVAFYNPRSARRSWQLGAACRLLLEHRPPTTPVGIVHDAARPGQRSTVTTLAGLDPGEVDMTTCVIVGASTTTVVAGRMVTPRGLPQP